MQRLGSTAEIWFQAGQRRRPTPTLYSEEVQKGGLGGSGGGVVRKCMKVHRDAALRVLFDFFFNILAML